MVVWSPEHKLHYQHTKHDNLNTDMDFVLTRLTRKSYKFKCQKLLFNVTHTEATPRPIKLSLPKADLVLQPSEENRINLFIVISYQKEKLYPRKFWH